MSSRLRKAFASLGDDTTLSRFVKVPPEDRLPPRFDKPDRKPQQTWFPDMRHEVLRTGRSIFFRKGVSKVSSLKNLLVSGHSNAKIGRDVRKGLFRGYWIYTLSLEERATCPRSCHHWQTCYGNGMPYAKRVDHRDYAALTTALSAQIEKLLSVRGRRGILIRLHALGDFFSPAYVHFWKEMLRNYPNLAIYGYTARQPKTDIGRSIAAGKQEFGRRFAIRWSDGGQPTDCTVSIRHAEDKPANAFICPEQTWRTAACATCGACWSGLKNVAFLEH